MKDKKTQLEILMEYFKQNPNKDISHPEIVHWAVEEWHKQTKSVLWERNTK